MHATRISSTFKLSPRNCGHRDVMTAISVSDCDRGWATRSNSAVSIKFCLWRNIMVLRKVPFIYYLGEKKRQVCDGL